MYLTLKRRYIWAEGISSHAKTALKVGSSADGSKNTQTDATGAAVVIPRYHIGISVRDFGQRNKRQTRFRKFRESGFIKGSSWSNRQGSLSANRDVEGSSGSVVVGQAWVGAGQTKAYFRGAGRVEVGGRRGSEPGRRRRGSRADVGQMETVAGEGTWTQTKAGRMQT